MIILDYFLSNETGEKVCLKIKSYDQFKNIPILFVSSSGFVNERIEAFQSGACDFISRPFNKKELFYRLKVHWPETQKKNILQISNLVFDIKKSIFAIDEQELQLTQKEFLILKYLLDNHHRVIYRDELKNNIWGYSDVSNGNVDTQIYNLKRKLENFKGEIRTLNRVGFRIIPKNDN